MFPNSLYSSCLPPVRKLLGSTVLAEVRTAVISIAEALGLRFEEKAETGFYRRKAGGHRERQREGVEEGAGFYACPILLMISKSGLHWAC